MIVIESKVAIRRLASCSQFKRDIFSYLDHTMVEQPFNLLRKKTQFIWCQDVSRKRAKEGEEKVELILSVAHIK